MKRLVLTCYARVCWWLYRSRVRRIQRLVVKAYGYSLSNGEIRPPEGYLDTRALHHLNHGAAEIQPGLLDLLLSPSHAAAT